MFKSFNISRLKALFRQGGQGQWDMVDKVVIDLVVNREEDLLWVEIFLGAFD